MSAVPFRTNSKATQFLAKINEFALVPTLCCSFCRCLSTQWCVLADISVWLSSLLLQVPAVSCVFVIAVNGFLVRERPCCCKFLLLVLFLSLLSMVS
jgi:hypothetical protein